MIFRRSSPSRSARETGRREAGEMEGRIMRADLIVSLAALVVLVIAALSLTDASLGSLMAQIDAARP